MSAVSAKAASISASKGKGARAATSVALVIGMRLEPCTAELPSMRDGVWTSMRTFQKFFTEKEVAQYVLQVLARPCRIAAAGVLYVFA